MREKKGRVEASPVEQGRGTAKLRGRKNGHGTQPSHTESLHGASGLKPGPFKPQNNRHLTAYWSRFRAAMECHSFCGDCHDDYTTRAVRGPQRSVILSLFSQCDQMQGFWHWGHLCGVLESTERAHSADLSETRGVTSHNGDTRLNLKK